MTLKNWWRMIWTTAVIGAAVTLVIGVCLELLDQKYSSQLTVGAFGVDVLNIILGGLMFGVLCQMGFFAYMMLNYIALGIVRRKRLWQWIQIFATVIAVFELGVWRYLKFGGDEETFFHYIDLSLLILAVALGVAYWKMKLTNPNGFIPSMFFITVFTILEAIPALRLDNWPSTWFMLIPLLVCNSWQILILHKLVKRDRASSQTQGTQKISG